MGDVLKDDDFLDAALMTINAERVPKEYQKNIQYLDGMKFLIIAINVVRTRIMHKSRNYSIIDDQLYFQGKDGVLRQTIGKGEISRLLYEFHDGFYGSHFASRITTKKILQTNYYWPTFFKDAHDYYRSCDVCQTYA